ncbi:hypothetical protein Q9966_011531 [Columba livia]|nr:hypothetical protein Q9966_011531 [Columba livia]
MNSLEFCNAVIQVAHPLVQKQLVDYVHNGFLVPVMGPALHKTSIEEMIASTAYLDLFLRSVSETALLKTFLRFVLLHRHDSSTILDTLVARINSNSRLCMVSLSLFRTLLSLNCEDVMLQLVLRYLLPCSHVMLSQKRAVRDLDIYGKTAAKFLSLVPRCCRPEGPVPTEREEEHAAWSRGHGSPGVDASSVVTVPKPSTPSRLSFFMRQASAAPEAAAPAPHSPGTPSGSPGHRGRWDEVSELDRNYLEYLRDARRSIDRCAWACRVWSAPYDGEEPGSPPGPPTPRTKKRGLPEEGAREGQGGPPRGADPGAGGGRPRGAGLGEPGERGARAGGAGAARGGRGGEEGSAQPPGRRRGAPPRAGAPVGPGAERGPPGLGAAALGGLADRGAAGPGAGRAQRRRRQHRGVHRGAAGDRGRDEERRRGGPARPPGAPRAVPRGGGGGRLRQLRRAARGGRRGPGDGAGAGPAGAGGGQPAAGPGAAPQPALHRPLRVGAVRQAGEHAAQLAVRELPADRAGGPAGLLPAAAAALLPAQHQHGLPAQRQVPAAGPGLGEEQDRELCRQPGGLPGAALQGQEVPDRAGQAGLVGRAGRGAGAAPQRLAGAAPEAVPGGAAAAARAQPHARAGGPPRAAAGAGAAVPGRAGAARAARAARQERRVLRRHLLRVPQGAGGHRAGPRRHVALPLRAPRGVTPALSPGHGPF